MKIECKFYTILKYRAVWIGNRAVYISIGNYRAISIGQSVSVGMQESPVNYYSGKMMIIGPFEYPQEPVLHCDL